MSRFSSFGPLDSPIADGGDNSFVRVNNRLRGDQLKPGEVSNSVNGRMDLDGAWQTRKGVNAVGGTLTANTRALRLTSPATWRLIGNRATDAIGDCFYDAVDTAVEVTITFDSDLKIEPSQAVTLSGFTQTGPLAGTFPWDINGAPYTAHSGTTAGSLVISTTIPGSASGAPSETEFTWTGGTVSVSYPIAISSATRSTTTVTVDTATPHCLTSNTLANISGLTGTVDPNGNRLVTVTDIDTFTFTIAGATGSETYSGSGVVKGATFSATQTNGVYGYCRFSDPSNSNAEYILRATNQNVIAVPVAGGNSTTINYPTGVTIVDQCELLQCFDRVILFRDGLTALEWNGDLSGTPAFTLVANGAYTQPTYFNSSNNTVIADGRVTVTESSHGLSVGDRVYVIDAGASTLTVNDGGYTVASVPTSGTFTFYAEVEDLSSHSVVFSKKVSIGTGYTHMTAPPWGVYHQRRLWTPYFYTMAGSSGSSPTITDREIRDEVIASDILDSDTYDRLQNQFRITGGTADYLVALEPFAEDNLLAFNRNSIHLLSGISGSLADITVRQITNEVGCVARKSVVQIGNQVLFLSDNGVYSASFGDLYNLRGAGIPLSEPVNATIQRINRDYAYKAVAAYFSNRYYLAVPLDDSTANNAILVYNFLNQGWESLDTISQEGWDILGFVTASNGGLNNLYSISASGSIHQIDAREDDKDVLSLYAGVAAASYPVESTVSTRLYTLGTIERKKFSTYELHVESSASQASDGSIGIVVENPDYAATLTTVNAVNGSSVAPSEDASLRGRIGNKRGYGAQMVFTPTAGRPKLRAVSVNASITNQTTASAS